MTKAFEMLSATPVSEAESRALQTHPNSELHPGGESLFAVICTGMVSADLGCLLPFDVPLMCLDSPVAYALDAVCQNRGLYGAENPAEHVEALLHKDRASHPAIPVEERVYQQQTGVKPSDCRQFLVCIG